MVLGNALSTAFQSLCFVYKPINQWKLTLVWAVCCGLCVGARTVPELPVPLASRWTHSTEGFRGMKRNIFSSDELAGGPQHGLEERRRF